MSAVAVEPLFSLAAPNVGEMEAGQVVEGEYGPATILSIEVGRWRFSEKPKHLLTFRDHYSGEEFVRSYFPWSPIKNNHAYEARFTAPHVNPQGLAPRKPYRSSR